MHWELQEWKYLDVIQSDHEKCTSTWNEKKIQSDHDEKFMHMKWKIYNGNTFLKINQNSKNSMLTFDCFTTREIMREREGIEERNMKIIDRFSYSDGGTKVKSYFSEE